MESGTGKVEQWFRLYSENLANSYRATALLEHRLTKGEAREHQVLDLIRRLLPKRIELETGVVISDSNDAESPKFDAVLTDRLFWPRLFEQHGTAVVMIESVLAAIEIKSTLNAAEMQDIFTKAMRLREMRCAGAGTGPCPPRVCAFAYSCENLSLAFFDFACAYMRSPAMSATTICVLNGGVMFLCRRDGGTVVPADVPSPGLIPALAIIGADALLMFTYILSNWASLGSGAAEIYRTYGRHVLSSAIVTHFDDDYLAAISQDVASCEIAREAFLRSSDVPLAELYSPSRRRIGLSYRVFNIRVGTPSDCRLTARSPESGSIRAGRGCRRRGRRRLSCRRVFPLTDRRRLSRRRPPLPPDCGSHAAAG